VWQLPCVYLPLEWLGSVAGMRIPPKVTADSGDRDRLGNRGGAGGVNLARSVTISQIGDTGWAATDRRRTGVFFLKTSAAVAPQAFSAGSGGGAAQCG
jgi:hypothetical protein